MQRILILSTYSIKNPTGGGQKRVAAIVDSYKEAGHLVKHVAIYLDTANTGPAKADIAVSWDMYNKNPLAYVIGDLLLSNALDIDEKARLKFRKILDEFKPTVIQIEQTFLYKTVKSFLDSSGWAVKMINSTHNIESELKRDILTTSTDLEKDEIEGHVRAIDSIEKFAARDADITIACTEADMKKLISYGAKEVILAPNGIVLNVLDIEHAKKLEMHYKKAGVDKIILYVGSAHPPNLSGFVELIGGRVGFVPVNAKIIIAGGVSNLVYDYARKLPNYIKPIFNHRVELLGLVSEKKLTSLLHIADQIILPIMDGGGSNLKTAEAILADKHIVATSKSFRSYEKYINLPNIDIADDGPRFRELMLKALLSPKKSRTISQQKLASGVQWSNTLKSITERLSSL